MDKGKPSETKKDAHKKQANQKEADAQKIEELTTTLQRLQAEFENYKKRVEKEHAQYKTYAAKDIIASLLPVLDSFELALKHCQEKGTFVDGMKLVYGQLYSILEHAGLRAIEAVGKRFDPYYHEVLMQEPTQSDEGKILEEFQKGYMFKDMVIRHAKVKVAKVTENVEAERAAEEKQ